MNRLTLITVQLAAFTALYVLTLGFEWIETGRGFHPVAAGALALALLIAPHLIPQRWCE